MDLPPTIHAIQLNPADVALVEAFADPRALSTVSHASVEEFLGGYAAGDAACVVLGSDATGEASLAALGQVRQHPVFAPVIVVTEAPSVELAVRAMQMGAAAVLSRPVNAPALEAELTRALEVDARERAVRARREIIAARLAALTEREREVLTRLMEGMANKNIAAELQIGLRTVELRRAKILKKLGAKSVAEMVRLVVLAEPERLWRE
jgi:FixJ family two-component response regulator